MFNRNEWILIYIELYKYIDKFGKYPDKRYIINIRYGVLGINQQFNIDLYKWYLKQTNNTLNSKYKEIERKYIIKLLNCLPFPRN